MERKIILHKTPGHTVYSDVGTGRVTHFFTDEYFCASTKSVRTIPGKGAIVNRLSSILFEQLHGWNIPTHFVSMSNMRTSLVRQAEAFLFSLKIYCSVDPEMAEHLTLEDGMAFSPFVVEYLGPKNQYHLNDDFLIAMDWIDQDELEALVAMALRCVHGLQGFFSALGFHLLHIELRFGRDDEGDLILLGILGPENICLRHQKSGKIMGSGYLHQNPEEQYKFFAENLLGKEKRFGGSVDSFFVTLPKARNHGPLPSAFSAESIKKDVDLPPNTTPISSHPEGYPPNIQK